MANQTYSIFHDLFLNADLDKVYDTIVQPDHLINWWPLKCSGTPELGHIYNFYFTPEYDWYGKVQKIEKNKCFHIKMTQSDPDWDPTSFGFDLQQEPNGIALQFWHIGWSECNHHFRRSSFCWAILLNGLKNYVEKGDIIPFEDRE